MKPRFTIVSSVYNEYKLLRQFTESILHSVDPSTYAQVIIVDDFSDPNPKGKLRGYENYLNKNQPKFRIINFPEYRHARWYGEYDPEIHFNSKSSMGVVCSYQHALEFVRTEFVILCDTDCVFLSKFGDTLNTIVDLYDQHPNVMTIAQLQGHASNDVYETSEHGCKYIPNEVGQIGRAHV